MSKYDILYFLLNSPIVAAFRCGLLLQSDCSGSIDFEIHLELSGSVLTSLALTSKGMRCFSDLVRIVVPDLVGTFILAART